MALDKLEWIKSISQLTNRTFKVTIGNSDDHTELSSYWYLHYGKYTKLNLLKVHLEHLRLTHECNRVEEFEEYK